MCAVILFCKIGWHWFHKVFPSVRFPEDVEDDSTTFHPEYSHQIYGDEWVLCPHPDSALLIMKRFSIHLLPVLQLIISYFHFFFFSCLLPCFHTYASGFTLSLGSTECNFTNTHSQQLFCRRWREVSSQVCKDKKVCMNTGLSCLWYWSRRNAVKSHIWTWLLLTTLLAVTPVSAVVTL